LSTVREEGLQARGEEWPEREKHDFEEMIRAQYDTQGNPLYASGRLWDDGVIDPLETRAVLAHGLSAAMKHEQPDETAFGIFRM
jgi:3-methylcrotonyl-CoA carboxylase beta subunit